MRAVDEQLERIIRLLMFLMRDKDSDAKTSSDAQCLLGVICTFNFIFSLCVLKFILANTNALCKYFQGKSVDVFNARKKVNMTISTLQKWRYELHFANIWEKAKIISSNIKTWDNDDAPEIEFKEPCLPRGRTSVQDQDLESYYRVKCFYKGMDEVIGELTYRFQGRDNDIVCALGEICLGENVTVERSFSTLRRVKSYLRSPMGQTRVSSLAIINIEISFANRLLQKSTDRIIDIFGKRNNRESFF